MIMTKMLFIFFLAISGDFHDIHVSITEIEIMENKVEITVKTFLDDLQLAVGLVPGTELPEDYTSSDELIQEYLESTLRLNFDENEHAFNISDISSANDAVWISLDLDNYSSTPAKVSLESSFLTDVYDDQTNIVNIKTNGNKESFILNKKRKLISYELDP